MNYLTRKSIKTLLLSAGLVCFMATGASAVVRIVSTSPGPGEFGSLGAAVAASNAAGLPGDSIRVLPGVYDEAGIVVTVASLSIQGMGVNASDVVFNNASAPGTGSLIDWSGTAGGSMDNMMITDYADAVSAPGLTTGFTATGLLLVGNSAEGIDMRLTGGSSLTGNTAYSNGGSGILLRVAAAAATVVSGNCIYNNGVGPTDHEPSNIWSGNYYGGASCVSPFPILGGGGLSDLAPACNENEVGGPATHHVLATETYTFTYTPVSCIDPASGLAAFDFEVHFDDAKLEYVGGSAVDGNAIPNQLPMQVDDALASSGIIRLSAASGGGLDILTSPAMLASLDFKAIDVDAASTISVASDYRDGANNPWPVAGVSFDADIVDETDPTCANLTPNNPSGDNTYSEGGPGAGPHFLLDVSIDIADDFDSRRMLYRIDGGTVKHFAWSSGGAGPETLGPVNIPLGAESDGAHTLKMWAEDQALNHGDTCTYDFTIDRTGPVLSSVTLKDADGCAFDPDFTNDPNILMDIVGDGTEAEMEIWDGSWNPKEAFDGTDHPFTIGATDGLYTIFARLTDAYGNTGNQLSDAITLDQVAPSPTGPLAIAPDPTSTLAVTVSLASHGGAPQYILSETEADLDDCLNAGWTANCCGPSSLPFTLAAGDGTHTVYYAARDEAGNVSAHMSATVELDQTAGDAPTVAVADPDGTDCSDSWTVDVTVTYSQTDATELCLTTNGGTGATTCVAATGSPQVVSYTLDATDRVCDADNTVNVTVKDDATPKNESAAGSGSIFVDCAVPTVTAVELNNGDAWSQSATVNVHVTGSADAVMVRMAELCADIPSATWEAIDMTGGEGDVSFTFPAPICGTNNVVVQLMDCAGRMSTVGCVSGVDFDGIFVDESDPTIVGVDLDAGAALTNATPSAIVSLDLDTPADNCGLVDMRASFSADFNGDTDPWSAYPIASFDLDEGTPGSAGDGNYVVYVQLRDGSGRVSAIVSDDIDLDRTDPVVDGGPLFILSGNPDAASGFTNSLSGNSLEGINGPGDVADMHIQNVSGGVTNITGWVPFSAASFALPALGTTGDPGTLEVRIRLRDNAGNVGAFTSATIAYAGSFASGGSSIIPGGAASGAPGGSMLMSWPAQTGAQKYWVKYDRWGNYPFYNTPVPTPPGTLGEGFPLAGPVEVMAGSDPVELDFDASIDPTADIYAMSIWTVDMYGNTSPSPNVDILETNYILGDGKGAANEFDNALSFVDEFGLLAAAMFTVDGDAGFNAFLDIGPTISGDAKDYPTPDGAVEFEDLVIFAINFANHGAARIVPNSAPFASALTVSAAVPNVAVDAGSKIRVPISISDPNAAKGMHLVFDYDQSSLRLLSVEQGAMFNTATGRTFFAVRPGVENIDINAVSLDAAFSNNEVAVLTFEAISNTSVEIVDEDITVRDQSNEDIEVAFSTNPVSDRSAIIPSVYAVSQNYPNPFNPSTKIDVSLPESGAYKLEIFNTLGQKVTTFEGYSDAGIVTVEWMASESASGVYFYRLTANSYQATKKMVLLK